jgi:hypothetical protein
MRWNATETPEVCVVILHFGITDYTKLSVIPWSQDICTKLTIVFKSSTDMQTRFYMHTLFH